MITDHFKTQVHGKLEALKRDGLYKTERNIESPQASSVRVAGHADSRVNFCANNYLGLTDHPELIAVAAEAVERYG